MIRANAGLLVILSLAAFFLLAFPVRILECDAVVFASGALHKDAAVMSYAHHLGYNLFQHVAALAGRAMTPPLSPIYILQYLSVAAGLAGIAVFYRLLIRLGAQASRAVACTGALAFSYAYWHYSRQADTHVVAALLLICFLSRFERFLRSPTVGAGALSGLVLGLATLMHQSNILLLPAVAASVLLRARRTRGLLRSTGALVALALGVAAGPYPIVGRALAGARTLGEFREWIMGISTWGTWGNWRLELVPATLIGLIRSFIGSHYLLDFRPIASLAERLFPVASLEDEMAIAGVARNWLQGPLLAVQAGVLALALVALLRARARLKHLLGADRPFALFLVVWIVVYGVFFAWWAPERVEFWIAWLIPLLVVLAWPAGTGATGGRRAWVWASVFLGGLVFVNFAGSIYPQSGPLEEIDASAAVAIDAVVDKGDMVVSDCWFEGRASRFATSFDRVNLLDPPVEGLSVAGPRTLYRYWGLSRESVLLTSPPAIADLGAHAVSTVDSVLDVAGERKSEVYLLASPVSINRGRTKIYTGLVELIDQHFDISEVVPVRGGIDLRIVRRYPTEPVRPGSSIPQ